MKVNNKTIAKIWRESISTIIIITAIFVIHGNFNSQPQAITVGSVETESGELPSRHVSVEDTPEVIKEAVSIEQLVLDVESGKAGNGKARKEYLGEYYDEVQLIIDEKYKKKETSKNTSLGNTQRATTGSKAEYQAYAYDLVIAMGWSEDDFQALVNLWERESGWNPDSHNKSSGAHGIPQSLPASKMAAYGDDYYWNAETQIQWGINYILNRYGTPTAAWKHFCAKNWY